MMTEPMQVQRDRPEPRLRSLAVLAISTVASDAIAAAYHRGHRAGQEAMRERAAALLWSAIRALEIEEGP